jgi:hypothetical protein
MAILVFLLGRPGSGKSSAARLLTMLSRDQGWSARHFRDYDILLEWYRDEIDSGEFRRFRPAHKKSRQELNNPHEREKLYTSGFDVVDFTVLDSALDVFRNKIEFEMASSSKENEFFLIEFARNDYIRSLARFGTRLLEGAYFLFFDTDMYTCVVRVHERTNDPKESDNHFVSEEIIKNYYSHDIDWNEVSFLSMMGKIDMNHIMIIDNSFRIQDLIEKVDHITNHRFENINEIPLI